MNRKKFALIFSAVLILLSAVGTALYAVYAPSEPVGKTANVLVADE